jgi:hypothetical protein
MVRRNSMTETEVESKLKAYATGFISGYSEALGKNFIRAVQTIREMGLESSFLPLYGREPGKDTALAVLFTDHDFYMFFLEAENTLIKVCTGAGDAEGFDRNWTFTMPYETRLERAKEHLGITGDTILQVVNIPGTNFMPADAAYMADVGHGHGISFGNQAGAKAEQALPSLLESSRKAEQQAAFSERYGQLQASTMSAQARGQEFEKLWREVLEFHGWRPKKIRIPGEENDFTAIYQGLHILGEVRWFAEAMTGGKMREFLGKLDPRPQTIGLFISHSGLDEGAFSVVRRAVNSKTVVVFGRREIDAVLKEHTDPGAIFDEELRNAYDYIFEQHHQH